MITRTLSRLSSLSLSSIPSKTIWRFQEPLIEKPCRVLFAGTNFHAGYPLTQQVLKERGLHCNGDGDNEETKIELLHAKTPEDIERLAPTAHVAVPFMERFPKDFLERSTKLRLVQQYGVGLEGVDIDTATKLGIAVSNIPAHGTGNAQATSEHALWLTISLLRHHQDLQRRFQQQELGGLPIPRTLYKKRVTIVGYGSVGKMLTQYMVMMGAQVQVVRNRSWTETHDSIVIGEQDFEKVDSLHDALPTTDILILACVMTPQTYHMMNDETIQLLPEGAILVNVGRGHLVEYECVLKSIKAGHLGGFGSDVGIGHPTKPSEPWDPNDELSKFPNVLFTPHVGGYCDYSYTVMSNRIVGKSCFSFLFFELAALLPSLSTCLSLNHSQ